MTSLFLLCPAVGAETPIPPRLYSEERAAIFKLDRETLAARFEQQRRQCREAPGESYGDRASCRILEGLVSGFGDELEAGLAELAAAEEIFQNHRDGIGVALVRFMSAELERQVGNKESAVRGYRQAIAVIETLETSQEAVGIESFLIFMRLSGLPEEIFEMFRASASAFRPFLTGMAEVLMRDGFAALLLELDQIGEAEQQVEKALARSRALFGLFDTALLDRKARVRERQERLEEARALYIEALRASQRLGQMDRRMNLLWRKSQVEKVLGLEQDALASLDQTLTLARENGDVAKEVEALVDLSGLRFELGEVAMAQELSAQALALAERSEDPWSPILAQVEAGGLGIATGAYEQAARHLEAALTRLEELESWREDVKIYTVNVLSLLTQSYALLGRRELLASKLESIRELARSIDFEEAAALAEASERMDRFMEQENAITRAAFQESLTHLTDVLDSSSSPSLRRALAPLILGLEHLVSAIISEEPVEMSAEIVSDMDRVLEVFPVEAMRRISAARIAFDEERWDDASRHFEELATAAREGRHQEFEAMAAVGLAGAYKRLGELEKAAEEALRGIELFERQISVVHVDDLLMSYLGSNRRWFYDFAVVVLDEVGKTRKALEVSESARARTLLHQLSNRRVRLPDGSPWTERLEDLRLEITALEGRMDRGEAVRMKRAEYDELMVRAKLELAEYADLVHVEPIDLDTLQSEWLPPDTNLVLFHVVQHQVIVWSIDRASIESKRLPLEAADLEAVRRLSFERGVGPVRGGRTAGAADLEKLEERLFDTLIREVLPMARHDKWILVPHRQLHSVPFAALKDSQTGARLLDSKQLAFVPSASVLRHLKAKTSPFEGRALVLGDAASDLPWARVEARAVADLFETSARVGEAATERYLLEAGDAVDLVHLAVHGVFHPLTPRFSHVALAAGDGEDGRLEVEEIFRRLDLRGVDLVTLSACRTAVGEQTLGDEIVGLTRAFLYAGSPAVVSTLWPVDDRATAYLMTELYGQLLSGATYAEALRAAQEATRQRQGWSDPYYWAAFMLTGDPERRWERAATVSSPTEDSAY